MSQESYRVRLEEPLDREVVRVYRGQLNGARRVLKAPDDEGVHSARKAIKRSRAILRLIRGALAEERYRQLDQGLRAVGRRLGPVRDAMVSLALVETLRDEGALEASDAEALREVFEDEHARAWEAATAGEGIDGVRADLQDLRIDRSDVADLDVLTLYSGLAATYRSGHGRLAGAAQTGDVEAFHAWRRQAKYLGYQLRLLVLAWPAVLRPTVRAFEDLTDALGDDHDLAELVRRTREADLRRSLRRTVKAVAQARRSALQTGAWPLGARLYAEDAPRFAARVTVYLSAALAEQQRVPIHPLDGLAVPAPPNRSRVPPSVSV